MISYDSNVLIYFLENNADFGSLARDIVLRQDKGGVILSEIIRQEVLTGAALRDSDTFYSVRRAIELLQNTHFASFKPEIVDRAAELTLKYGRKVTGSDAIHVATALLNNTDISYTNDRDLLSIKRINNLEISPLV